MKPETFIAPNGAEVTLIHFQVVAGHLACMPGLRDLSATSGANNYRLTPHMRSGEPGAITCPMCRKTAEFVEAEQAVRSAIARANARR